MPRIVFLALIALLTVGCASDPCTTIVLVRHADRDGELLNDKGQARAQALRDLVAAEHGKATAVIYTTHERTRQTVAPIIDAAQPAEFEFEPEDFPAIAAVARQGSDAEVIVIAGHSNTIRPLLEQFDSTQVAAEWFPCEGEICHSDYDDIWTVTSCGDSITAINKATYGEPTPAE